MYIMMEKSLLGEDEDTVIKASDWGYLILLYGALHVIRGFVVFLFYPLLSHGEGLRSLCRGNYQSVYNLKKKEAVVLVYSGLRGAVGLVLGLIVAEDDEIDEKIQSR